MSNKLLCFMLCVFTVMPGEALSTSHDQQAAVAMPDSFSADVAKEILTNGGNAVDAAIAAQFVLAVTLPEAGNIGGGGFMLVVKDGESTFLDYRETAPSLARKNMYLDSEGNLMPGKSLYGIQSIGVPGTVEGMWQAHQRFASMPWKALIQPAIKLAKEGFEVHPKLAANIKQRLQRFSSKAFLERNIWVNFDDYFSEVQDKEIFVQAELAETLERIANEGKKGFYQGKTAALITELMKAKGGLITQSDLNDYRAKWRKPIEIKWRDMTLLSSPPPSSGGIAIYQWLSMYDLAKSRAGEAFTHNSIDYIHVLSEAGKRVFADRAKHLGDPDFYDVPVDMLMSNKYITERALAIDLDAISATETIRPGVQESIDTTHFSIVDKWGNAVANTTTLNISFGSGVIVPGGGFLLNDEMDDFSTKEGEANTYGALGGVANQIEPHKRMLSSMTPSMLIKNGMVKLVTGSPGGTTIITSVYQSMLNVMEFGMSAEDAVNAPRFHHQLHPKDTIWHHPGIASETLKGLSDKGYKLAEFPFGDLHLIIHKNGTYEAASQASGRGVSLVF